MRANEFIRGKIGTLVDRVNELDAKKKLIILIVITILLIILTSLLGLSIAGKPGNEYTDTIASTYITQGKLKDYDMYVTLKEIGNDFFNKNNQYVKSSKIKDKDIYNNILTGEYKRKITRIQFGKLYEKAMEVANEIKTSSIELIPENISTDNYGKYIIKYSYDNGQLVKNIYLGITLNQNSQKYYVWNLEVEE